MLIFCLLFWELFLSPTGSSFSYFHIYGAIIISKTNWINVIKSCYEVFFRASKLQQIKSQICFVFLENFTFVPHVITQILKYIIICSHILNETFPVCY